MTTVTIDDTILFAKDCRTIIDVAREHLIDIPSLGYDSRVSPPTNVEISVVEVLESGKSGIVSATATIITEGMVVNTRSPALEGFSQL